MGTLMPSSPALCEAMVQSVDWSERSMIVAELGAGDGVLTRHILRVMPADAKLSAYEINSRFYDDLEQINDSRLEIKKEKESKKLDSLFFIYFRVL